MSIYVMSDIHGCYGKFLTMLEKIGLCNDDELYILGDVFDRGPEPIKILDYIIGQKNIHLLRGNHEQMFLDTMNDSTNTQLWMLNGGYTTYEKMLEKGQEYINQVRDYIRRTEYIKVVGKFILVHAGVFISDDAIRLPIEQFIDIQDLDTCLWNRSNIGVERRYPGFTIICGHTPVQTLEQNKEPKILHREGHIYIDCGCVFEKANGKLACLRLDDMFEIYV